MGKGCLPLLGVPENPTDLFSRNGYNPTARTVERMHRWVETELEYTTCASDL